jgi:hypothetical protein
MSRRLPVVKPKQVIRALERAGFFIHHSTGILRKAFRMDAGRYSDGTRRQLHDDQSRKRDGGILKHPVPGAPSAWLAYVEVADIAAATGKAR